MLQTVDVAPKTLEPYESIIGAKKLAALRKVARRLKGARVAHISSTAYGGGVSELLHSVVPLYLALGVQAEWKIIPGEPEFFNVTKAIHNALQGAPIDLSADDRTLYLSYSKHLSSLLEGAYDFVFVHDPQPLALRQLHGRDGARWIWRCHIDTSEPNQEALAFLEPFIADYDALVFTMEQFLPPELNNHRVRIIPPGIDPLSPKNMAVPMHLCDQIVQWAGVHLDRPLLTQISRFDPWKDPLGVIEVYRRVAKEIPGTQLALLGQMALDDPQGWEMYSDIQEATAGEPDIHVLTNFTGIGNMEVNAFQSASDVVLQKSIREGFGLVVSETLWKGTPVVAGRAGGIPMQMPEGVGGFLIDDNDECVQRLLALLRDPRQARALADRGREHVREHFLVTRLVEDELDLLSSLI